MSDLKVGDVVQFKSGGPLMTVAGRDVKGPVLCRWFDKDGAMQKAFIGTEALVRQGSTFSSPTTG